MRRKSNTVFIMLEMFVKFKDVLLINHRIVNCTFCLWKTLGLETFLHI